jgi:hypothetical protein
MIWDRICDGRYSSLRYKEERQHRAVCRLRATRSAFRFETILAQLHGVTSLHLHFRKHCGDGAYRAPVEAMSPLREVQQV